MSGEGEVVEGELIESGTVTAGDVVNLVHDGSTRTALIKLQRYAYRGPIPDAPAKNVTPRPKIAP